LKDSKQNELVLLEVHLIEGKALGSVEREVLGRGLCYEQRKEFEPGIHCVGMLKLM
jgi:hypothetical protein